MSEENMTAQEAVRLLRQPAQEAKAVIKAYEAAQAVASLEAEIPALTERRDTLKGDVEELESDRAEAEAENKERSARLDDGIKELERRRDELVAGNGKLTREHEARMRNLDQEYEQRKTAKETELQEATAAAQHELDQVNAQLETAKTQIRKIQAGLPKVEA
jgi:chromosome segregation ATPase